MAISTPMLVTFLRLYIWHDPDRVYWHGVQPKNFDDYILGGTQLRADGHRTLCGRVRHERLAADGAAGGDFPSPGISESWIAIGLTVGAWINWKLVAGRLRVHTEANNNALTLPDYFTGRFEDNSRSAAHYLCAGYPACSSPSIVLQGLWQGRVCLKAPLA